MKCKFEKIGFCSRRNKNKHKCANSGCKNVAYTNNPSCQIQGNCWSDRARPGDKLRAMFRSLGVGRGKGCGQCDEHVSLMNSWGTERCKQEIETIVGWLEEASKKRHLPFSRTVARMAVQLAIWQAERELKGKKNF